MDEYQSDPSDLQHPTVRTLGHYEARAEAFRAGTRDYDARQNIDAMLSRITAPSPFALLAFGCGPGRDLKTLRELGHVAIGFDGAASLAAMVRADTGCEVWQQNFLALDLPVARFDGLFANASLFHVPTAALPRALRQLHATLKSGGVLFSSNPRGHNETGWYDDRYGVYHDLSAWRSFMAAAHFEELLVYYRPDGLPRKPPPCRAMAVRP
jgi:SAM-dependent methyltransferase